MKVQGYRNIIIQTESIYDVIILDKKIYKGWEYYVLGISSPASYSVLSVITFILEKKQYKKDFTVFWTLSMYSLILFKLEYFRIIFRRHHYWTN